MAIEILTQDSTRDELIEALGHINHEARRELRYDNLGRPNVRWQELHAFMNMLLDLLED